MKEIVIDLVKPSKLYITGDELDNMGRMLISILDNDTWKEYYDIVKMYNNEKDCSYVIDIRGNHDGILF
jgi:metallophosphoesterase superfamily enzyme